jgi:hypothetical protein
MKLFPQDSFATAGTRSPFATFRGKTVEGGVIDKRDEYRRNAEYCQHMADGTHNEAEKRSWLSLAQSWLKMIRQSPAVGAKQTAPGARPDDSKSSS